MDTKALYERLDTLAEALNHAGGTHGADELVSVLTDVLGLREEMVTPRHSRTPTTIWALDPDHRAQARSTVIRWLRDGGHIPPSRETGVLR